MSMIELVKSPVEFTEEPHGYHLGEKRLSGITSLIHEVLQLGVYPDASDFVKNVAIPRAGEYGSAVHHAIELYDELGVRDTHSVGKYGEWDVEAELDNYIRNKEGFIVIANEYTVSDNVRYASNIDNIWMEPNGDIVLVDTKTNNLAYYPGGEDGLKEYLSWQLSVYAYLFEKQNPSLKVAGLACNWLRGTDSRFWIIERKPDEQVALLLSVEWERDETGKFIYHGDAVAAQLMPPPMPMANTSMIVPQQLINYIAQIERNVAEAKAIQEEMKAKLRTAMENAGVKSWECDQFKATIAADSISTTIDSKRLKAEKPDIYAEYSKQTAKKGGFTIKMK